MNGDRKKTEKTERAPLKHRDAGTAFRHLNVHEFAAPAVNPAFVPEESRGEREDRGERFLAVRRGADRKRRAVEGRTLDPFRDQPGVVLRHRPGCSAADHKALPRRIE